MGGLSQLFVLTWNPTAMIGECWARMWRRTFNDVMSDHRVVEPMHDTIPNA